MDEMAFETIFFDVGGTLVFPNPQGTLGPLLSRGVQPSVRQLNLAERAAKRVLDEFYSKPRPVNTDHNYWDAYYTHLLDEIGITDDALKLDLMARARTSANWDRLQPNTADILRKLSRSYRLAVISNADGHIAQLLDRLGVADFFETITDSGQLGHEKPDPRIFAAAIASMGADPTQSLYIGDIYSVDYLGAQNSGMRALLLDRAGVYEQTPHDRVDSLEAVPDAVLKLT
jgi:HAD superfamily hydrolase (TIGR01549 family)